MPDTEQRQQFWVANWLSVEESMAGLLWRVWNVSTQRAVSGLSWPIWPHLSVAILWFHMETAWLLLEGNISNNIIRSWNWVIWKGMERGGSCRTCKLLVPVFQQKYLEIKYMQLEDGMETLLVTNVRYSMDKTGKLGHFYLMVVGICAVLWFPCTWPNPFEIRHKKCLLCL